MSETSEQEKILSSSNDEIIQSARELIFEKKDFEKAIETLNEYLETKPTNPYALCLLGQAYQKVHKTDEAFYAFDQSLSYHPKLADSLVGRALIYWKNRFEYEKGIEDFQTALKNHPSSVTSTKRYLTDLVNEFMQRIPTLEKEKKISQIKKYYSLGLATLGNGKVNQAISNFKKVLDPSVTTPPPPGKESGDTKSKDEYDDLDEQDLEEERELREEEERELVPEAYFQLGICQFNIGGKIGIQEAITNFEKCVEINPKHAKAYYNLGLCYDEEKEMGKSMHNYEKAIEVQPMFSDAYVNLGVQYRESLEDPARSLVCLDKYVSLVGDCYDETVFYNRGLCYTDLGKYELAVKSYERALSLREDFAQCHYNIGCLLHQYLDKPKRALDCYEKALEYSTKFTEAIHNKGLLLWKVLKDYTNAYKDFERASVLAMAKREDWKDTIEKNFDEFCEDMIMKVHEEEELEKQKEEKEGERNVDEKQKAKAKNRRDYLLFLCHLRLKNAMAAERMMTVIKKVNPRFRFLQKYIDRLETMKKIDDIERKRNDRKQKLKQRQKEEKSEEEDEEESEEEGEGEDDEKKYRTPPRLNKVTSMEEPPVYSPQEYPSEENIMKNIHTPLITPSFLRMEQFFENNSGEQYEKEFENELQREMKKYTKLITIRPRDKELLLGRAACYLDLGEAQKAIDDFKIVIKQDPKNAQALFGMALCFDELDKLDESVEHYKLTISVEPDNEMARYNLGIVYTKLEKFEEGLVQFTKTAEINELNFMTYYNMGYCYDELGQLEQAIKSYEKTLELNPNDEDCYFNCACCFRRLKQFEKAIEYYSKVIDMNDNNPESFYLRGQSFLAIKEEERARKDFEKTLEVNKDFVMEKEIMEFMKKK